ncbi:MAG: hypothetical protein ACOYNP_03645 [Gemmataceae bacterium]|jgi:hypothetical protein
MIIRTLALALAACVLGSPSLQANGHKKAVVVAPAPCVPMVAETYTAQRTVMRCEWSEERRQVTVMELVPEERVVRQKVCRMVPETRDVQVVRHVCKPVIEERMVERCVLKSEPVEKTVTRCVDRGHFECQPVGCKGHMKNVWVPCPTMETCTVVVNECRKERVMEKVSRARMHVEAVNDTVKVTTCKPVMETVDVKCTVMVCRPVTKEVVCRVPRMVPVVETYTACRMVPACGK